MVGSLEEGRAVAVQQPGETHTMELRDQEVTASAGFMHAPPRAACWRRGVAPLPSQHPSLCVKLNSSLVCEAADGLGLSAVTQNSPGIWSAC